MNEINLNDVPFRWKECKNLRLLLLNIIEHCSPEMLVLGKQIEVAKDIRKES